MVVCGVLEQYLMSLPDDLQCWVSYGDTKTAGQLVDMVERYIVVGDLPGPSKSVEPTPRAARPARLARPAAEPRKEALPDPETHISASSSSDLYKSALLGE